MIGEEIAQVIVDEIDECTLDRSACDNNDNKILN